MWCQRTEGIEHYRHSPESRPPRGGTMEEPPIDPLAKPRVRQAFNLSL